MKNKYYVVQIDQTTHDILREMSEDTGLSMKEVVTEALLDKRKAMDREAIAIEKDILSIQPPPATPSVPMEVPKAAPEQNPMPGEGGIIGGADGNQQ